MKYDAVKMHESIPMTPRRLYELAVANGVEDCQMYFPADELEWDVYLTMDDMCKEHRNFDKNKEMVVNIYR